METGYPSRRLARTPADALQAAFGADAGDPGAVDSPAALAWLRAVDLAGRGRFAAARSRCAAVVTGPFASAARCLEASMLRQSGGHRHASVSDGAAYALAAPLARDEGAAIAFRVDALVGLAADALGVGRFRLAATVLHRAGAELSAGAPAVAYPWWTVPRASLRRDWVAAELAVYSGDADGSARALPVLLAADPGAARPRHHAKTRLIAASAAAATGDLERAFDLARHGHAIATEGGFDPLQWAGAKLMSVLSGEGPGQRFAQEAAAVEARWIRDGAEMGRL